jgi:fatty-acyl-CoA synthase
MNALTLNALLAMRAARIAPMLIDRGRVVSHQALATESARVARGLAALGVRRGDRVALWMPNVPAWLALLFACARLGAIAVSVNTRFRSHEVADIVGRSGAKLLVLWPGFKGIDFAAILAGCDKSALERLESLVVYSEDAEPPAALAGKPVVSYAALAASPPLVDGDGAPEDGCVIFTTSGTTKAPKFVLHDQQTLVSHAMDVVRGFSLDSESVMLLAPPLCGVFGFCCAMASLAADRPLVMSPGWDAGQAARDIAAHGVTHLNATDDAILQLVSHATDALAFPSLKVVGYAAFNPALGDIVQRAEARGLRISGLYGTSEIQALFARQHEDAPAADRMLAGGRPVSAEACVRVRDPASGILLRDGESGELEFFAPGSRMVEYFGNAEATREAISHEGWYRSGDLGYTQADGRFVFLTRLGDSLRLGGFLVSPAEIEDVVQSAPGIAACQVVGVPQGDALKAVAFVIMKEGAALDEALVLKHVSAQLAKFKVPARVFAIDAFPVTPGANATKIQKGKLREIARVALEDSRTR